MARDVIEIIRCDVCGAEGARAVDFSHSGQNYEIDLCEEHDQALGEALSDFTSKARSAGRRGRGRRSANGRGGQDVKAIREWAREQGYEVSERGRIPREIVEAYESRRRR